MLWMNTTLAVGSPQGEQMAQQPTAPGTPTRKAHVLGGVIDRLRAADSELDEHQKRRLVALDEAADFWERRYVTVLGVANTAALLAMGTAFVQAEATDRAVLGAMIVEPMTFFAWGMILAGLIPVINFGGAKVRASTSLSRYMRRVSNMPTLRMRDVVDDTTSMAFTIAAAACCCASAILFVIGIAHTVGAVRGVVAAG